MRKAVTIMAIVIAGVLFSSNASAQCAQPNVSIKYVSGGPVKTVMVDSIPKAYGRTNHRNYYYFDFKKSGA